ncbi:hypothetical protein [Alcanivorax sp. 1008]|uniref:hypothetical protein n=1 Tax=Alcanivorax sp. 1008 TaxID=2816853 RepID=UPI001D1CB101|nr:hypothetical protein [Alcanivorax sp. 1008]MCC1496866.1 hypothetical protein [Alcanivorax sp. 1008]
MKRFFVMVHLPSPAAFHDGHVYQVTNQGTLIRATHAANGQLFAVAAKYGSALLEQAEAAAKKVGGFVLEIEGTSPDKEYVQGKILDHLEALQAAEIADTPQMIW